MTIDAKDKMYALIHKGKSQLLGALWNNTHNLEITGGAVVTKGYDAEVKQQCGDFVRAYKLPESGNQVTGSQPFFFLKGEGNWSATHHDHQSFGYIGNDNTGDIATGAAGFVICQSANDSNVLKDVWAFAPKDFIQVARAMRLQVEVPPDKQYPSWAGRLCQYEKELEQNGEGSSTAGDKAWNDELPRSQRDRYMLSYSIEMVTTCPRCPSTHLKQQRRTRWRWGQPPGTLWWMAGRCWWRRLKKRWTECRVVGSRVSA